MPDRNDIINNMTDKLWLQVEIDKHQGKSEKAMEMLQNSSECQELIAKYEHFKKKKQTV